MHPELSAIPEKILDTALGALKAANTQLVFRGPGIEHYQDIALVTAALAGELFFKAIVSKVHPLLIFRDLFNLESEHETELKISAAILRGKTYSFEQMGRVLWVAAHERLPDPHSYRQLIKARNSIQHFCAPEEDVTEIGLKFIYNNLDPLIHKHFGICAIEYNEDYSVGYDYVVQALINHELRFSLPKRFYVGEFNLSEAVKKTSKAYRRTFGDKLVELSGENREIF